MGLRVKSVVVFCFLHFPSAEDGGTKVQGRPGSPRCSQCGSLWQLRRRQRRRQQLCRPEEQEVALRHVLNKLHLGEGTSTRSPPLSSLPTSPSSLRAPSPPHSLCSPLLRVRVVEELCGSGVCDRPRRTGWKWMPDELVTSPGRTQNKKK